MYKYRNTKTGIEFNSVTECSGENIELVASDKQAEQPEEKPKAKTAKGKK